MTGETQFRAKRTRIKILRAIAERNGVAGFSDIKGSTGLSTGSIYYHLERMPDYITKDSKHYLITERGLRFLRELDPAFTRPGSPSKAEEQIRDLSDHQSPAVSGDHPEPASQDHKSRKRLLVFGAVSTAPIVVFVLSAAGLFSLTSSAMLIPISGVVLAFALSYASRWKAGPILGPGYRGLALFAISLGITFAWFFIFSDAQVVGTPQPKYENSMDALLSSYSLHWQIR